MELRVILILVLAASIHSFWNLLAKKSLDKQVFLWLTLVVAGVLFLPFFCYLYTGIPPAGWNYIIISACLEAVYFLLLGRAYQCGDLSLVYPVARGSAPLFVAFFAFLFLGEAVSPAGFAGIVLIVAGIYTLHLKTFDRQGLFAPFRSLRERSSQFALLTGLATAGYSTVDKVGVGYVNPVLYIYLVFIGAAILLAPYMLHYKCELARREWRENKKEIAAVAVMIAAAYLLVLMAMTTSKVSYVSSVREISVVFAALLGSLVLREPFGGMKILGSLFIFSGIVCIALAR